MASNPTRIFAALAALAALAARTAVAANLLSNPDFDNGVAGWVPRTPGHDVLAIVPDGSPTAPALDISPVVPPGGDGIAYSECVTISTPTVDLIVIGKLPTVEPTVLGLASIVFFTSSDCAVSTDIIDNNYLDWTSADVGWVEKSLLNKTVPAGTMSASIYLRSDSGPGESKHMLFDHIRFGPSGSVPVELFQFGVN
jgi:hypothetical protein